ncbi:MAG TPA: hypothetical protein VH986_04575 [Acidimicrobiia bacterium]
MTGKDSLNETILYHGAISGAMTSERTALESALIPVTAYILIACVEAYRRYPEMMQTIAAAVPPAELGSMGRRPGNQIDAVHLWSIVNFPLLARQILAPFGMIDLDDDARRLTTIFDFWRPAAQSFRADGYVQAWDAGLSVPRYGGEVIGELLEGSETVDETRRADVARANATLTSFLFLLYFDTRAGYQDSGPYKLADGRTMLVRDFNEFGVSHFPWSRDVCAELPCSNLTVAFVMDGVSFTTNDWGTSITDPIDYLAHTDAVGVFEPVDGALRRLPLGGLGSLTASVQQAQRALYRTIAGMERAQKIDAGAYVYFTFLRPFARAAGVEDQLDWTVPRDSMDVYEAMSSIERMPEVTYDPSVPYYTPIP